MSKIEDAARAFVENLEKQAKENGHYFRFDDDLEDVQLDGYFDILSAMHAAIKEIREPSGEMKDAGAATFEARIYSKSLDGQPSRAWRAMIDTLLSEEGK